MRNFFSKLIRALLFIAFFCACGISYGIYTRTLVKWWIPVGVALCTAALTVFCYRKWAWLTTTDNKAANLLCHFVCAGIIGYTLFLSGNLLLADPASTYQEEVVIVNKYQEKHKKTRRVGRHRYIPDGERIEYYITIAFDNGSTKNQSVTLRTYNKTRKGQHKVLTMQRGKFGYPVFKP